MWGIVLGYIVGSLLGGELYSKLSGHDLSTEGSRNPGARNAGRVGGKKAFLFVYGFDFFKTTIVLALQPTYFWETALALTLGHLYPFWRLRHGGKGYAVFSGVIWAYDPLWFIGGLLVLAGLVKVTGNSRETGLWMLLLLPLAAWGEVSHVVLASVIAALILYHHVKGETT